MIWSVVAGYLLLPSGFDIELSGLPDFNKSTSISLSLCIAFIFCYFRDLRAEKVRGVKKRPSPILLMRSVFIVLLFVSYFFTIQNNSYPLIDFDRWQRVEVIRPGLNTKDFVNYIAFTVMTLVPFIAAWHWMRTTKLHTELLICLVVCGVFYSFLAVIEMRFSPQINVWVYGYFQHSFAQHVRDGQFRPLVFLTHGLDLAFYLLVVVLSACGLLRSQKNPRSKILFASLGTLVLLVLLVSPNLGVALLSIVIIPIALSMSRKLQVRLAVIAAIFFLAFPIARQYVPLQSFTNLVDSVSTDRAQSFQYRLDNEDRMLDRAFEKPFFGWGAWGRWRVYDENGQDATVSDGIWIIYLAERGLFGFLLFFGLFTLPLFALLFSEKFHSMSVTTSTLAVITAANLIYMIPNATLTPIGWMISGAIAGFVSSRNLSDRLDSVPRRPVSRTVRYTRFPS